MALDKYIVAAVGVATTYALLPGAPPAAPTTFPVPATTAVERLEIERRVVEGTGLGSLTVQSVGTANNVLRMQITAAGQPGRVACRVTVTPTAPDTSSAEVDCAQPASDDQEMRQVAAEAMAIVLREHVAATIEQRPYDIDRTADRMLAFAVINRPAFARSLSE